MGRFVMRRVFMEWYVTGLVDTGKKSGARCHETSWLGDFIGRSFKKLGRKSARRIVLSQAVIKRDIKGTVVMGRVVMKQTFMGKDVMGQVVQVSTWLSLNLPLSGLRQVENLHIWSYCPKGLWPETFQYQCKAQLEIQRTVNIVVYNTYNRKFIMFPIL